MEHDTPQNQPLEDQTPKEASADAVLPEPPAALVSPQSPAAPVRGSALDPQHESIPEEVLLPKQETPGQTILSASRAPVADVLRAAQTPKVQKAPSIPKPQIAQYTEYASEVVPAIHTYTSDTEDAIRGDHITKVDVAAAEAKRREREPEAFEKSPSEKRESIRRFFQITLGIVCIVCALAGLAYALIRPAALPGAVHIITPFIYVDENKTLTLSHDSSHSVLMQQLHSAAQSSNISIGLIAAFTIGSLSTTSPQTQALSAQDFFSRIAEHAPDQLRRSLSDPFLLGVHVLDGNQPFLLFKTNSYEQTYAGMLSWEENMAQDLSPLFVFPSIPQATSSTQVLQSPFVDQIVANRDARVILDQHGSILLLWTFLDRNTLLITTGEPTLKAIISRLQQAPVFHY